MQFENVFFERTNKMKSRIETGFCIISDACFRRDVAVLRIVAPSFYCVYCCPYNLHRDLSALFFPHTSCLHNLNVFNQALGFYNKLGFEKGLLVSGWRSLTTDAPCNTGQYVNTNLKEIWQQITFLNCWNYYSHWNQTWNQPILKHDKQLRMATTTV